MAHWLRWWSLTQPDPSLIYGITEGIKCLGKSPCGHTVALECVGGGCHPSTLLVCLYNEQLLNDCLSTNAVLCFSEELSKCKTSLGLDVVYSRLCCLWSSTCIWAWNHFILLTVASFSQDMARVQRLSLLHTSRRLLFTNLLIWSSWLFVIP